MAEIYKPYLKQLCAKVKSKDKNVILHSCGNIWEILDQVIEIGVDCYNTVQPEIYDLNQLVNEFGKDLTFYGGISNQTFRQMPHPKKWKKCLETMEVLNRYHGYILSPTHSVTPDIPLKIICHCKAAKNIWLRKGIWLRFGS